MNALQSQLCMAKGNMQQMQSRSVNFQQMRSKYDMEHSTAVKVYYGLKVDLLLRLCVLLAQSVPHAVAAAGHSISPCNKGPCDEADY